MHFSCNYEVNGLEKLDERELEKILKETASYFKWKVEINNQHYTAFGENEGCLKKIRIKIGLFGLGGFSLDYRKSVPQVLSTSDSDEHVANYLTALRKYVANYIDDNSAKNNKVK